MAKVFTITVPPKLGNKRRERTSDPRYVDGQRLLVEAMKYLAQADPVQNRPAQNQPAWKRWEHSTRTEGADDGVGLGICPLCEGTLKLAYPDAVDVGGQIVHATCADRMTGQPLKQ